MTTRIYLDVDGVLNAVTRQTPEGTGWEMWEKVGVNGYTITYAPELVAALNEIAERDDVEIVWLTTWQGNAASMISPAIGLDGQQWRVVDNPDTDPHGFATQQNYGYWWKVNVFQDDLFNRVERDTPLPEKIIWIDDDLSMFGQAVRWFDALETKTLGISPFTVQGLTQHDVCAIIDFINES